MADVILNQKKGMLRFSIPNIIEPCILRAVDVKYSNAEKYRWRGTTLDKNIDVTIIKGENGYSGILIDAFNDALYRLFPVNMEESILIKTGDKFISCSVEVDESTQVPPLSEDCDKICLGHIDILFLVTPEAQDWMVSSEFNSMYFDLMISELEMVWRNSNVPHTVNYEWDSFFWELNEDEYCRDIAIDFANDNQAQQLREDHHADLVVLLTPPNLIWDDALACVPYIGPIMDEAFCLIPIDLALTEYIFSHEIGHLFGAQHTYSPHPPVDSDCAYAHKLLFDSGFKYTVLGGADNRIPHYSDPEISYNDVLTGLSSDIYDDHNNAGRIRETGCIISGFEESNTTNALIINGTDYDNCMMGLEAMVEPVNSDYNYEWYWSEEGLFTSQYPGAYLGSGQNLTILPPDDNPCFTFFIQLVVSLNGEIVATQSVARQGGICTDNVDDCDDPQGLVSFPNTNFATYQEINKYQLKEISLSNNSTYHIFDVYGRLVHKAKNVTNSMSLQSGVYFVVEQKINGQINTKKIIVHQ